jgi:TRAP-type mannitol/chloroaromatic compound transport system permease large subunit
MADQLGRSVGDMYAGAFVPGLVLSSLYASYIFGVAMLFPAAAPGLPPETQTLKDEDGKVRRLSLAVVVTISAIVAYYVMQQTNVRGGPDFVILMMSVGVVVAFAMLRSTGYSD